MKVNKKGYLYEICLIRLLLIVLLVMHHTFAPFSGIWSPLHNQETVTPYYFWIAPLSYSFMLETFTFISGYIFGFQVSVKGDGILTAHNVIIKKLKRLIVPSIIFSVVYLLLFNPDIFSTPAEASYQIIAGSGHMWYLPMLFWCFTGVYLIEKVKLSAKSTIVLLTLLAFLCVVEMPFQLTEMTYYMLFFYLGYCLKRFKLDTSRFINVKNFSISAALFIVLFAGGKLTIKSGMIPEMLDYMGVNGGG